jgi:hypothetical protein
MKRYSQSTSISRLYAFYVLALLGGCSTLEQKQARLLDATSFGMEQIAPRVYVSKEVSENQRKQLLDAIEKARHRVTSFYGSLVSDPALYACAARECIEFFGGRGDGYAVKATGILLWQKSFIPEAIAHEWSHVELFARLDGKFMGMPGWFTEGLAVVVSELPNHSEAVYQEAVSSGYLIPSMRDLAGRDWDFKKFENPKGLNVFYSTAGHEVRTWYQRVGQPGLLNLTEALKAGKRFSDVYR